MNFLGKIEKRQTQACEIEPPRSRENPLLNREKARGGVPGPAFFPEGMGLLNPGKWIGGARPLIMVVGHNFGSCGYRDGLEPKEFKKKRNGREDDEKTWKYLASSLDVANITIDQRKVSIDDCFMTNWFIGLLPGEKKYEAQCLDLLKQQIKEIQPRLILLLGKVVVQKTSQHFSDLESWGWKTKTEPSWPKIHRAGVLSLTSLSANPIAVIGLSHTGFGFKPDVLKTNLRALSQVQLEVGL